MIKLSGVKNLVGEEDFKNALYAIDIGQNDLAAAFGQGLSLEQVVEKIPSFISEIKDAILVSLLNFRNFDHLRVRGTIYIVK